MKRFVLAGALALAAVLALVAGRSQAQTEAAKPPPAGEAVATFAGGCFWCMEAAFQHVPGVSAAISGYTGGHVPNPSYERVSQRDTGHKESVRVVYDPKKLTYQKLLDIYWHNIDPFDNRGQFCDKGDEYRPVIFYHTDEQKKLADATKAKYVARFKRPLAVEIEPAKTFYVAEDYHQDYYEKNPVRYKFYRYNCGRDQRLQQVWGADAPPATH
jgi:peptide-methionine (S)-S-oxide reductase